MTTVRLSRRAFLGGSAALAARPAFAGSPGLHPQPISLFVHDGTLSWHRAVDAALRAGAGAATLVVGERLPPGRSHAPLPSLVSWSALGMLDAEKLAALLRACEPSRIASSFGAGREAAPSAERWYRLGKLVAQPLRVRRVLVDLASGGILPPTEEIARGLAAFRAGLGETGAPLVVVRPMIDPARTG